MADRLKYGVIGLGWFGEKHCEALAGIETVELYALCTRTAARLKEVGQTFKVKRLYRDYNEMLADPELDAVSVTTMWDQHVKPSVAALSAGKHVFLEKPPGATVSEVEDLKRLAAEKGVSLLASWQPFCLKMVGMRAYFTVVW